MKKRPTFRFDLRAAHFLTSRECAFYMYFIACASTVKAICCDFHALKQKTNKSAWLCHRFLLQSLFCLHARSQHFPSSFAAANEEILWKWNVARKSTTNDLGWCTFSVFNCELWWMGWSLHVFNSPLFLPISRQPVQVYCELTFRGDFKRFSSKQNRNCFVRVYERSPATCISGDSLI